MKFFQVDGYTKTEMLTVAFENIVGLFILLIMIQELHQLIKVTVEIKLFNLQRLPILRLGPFLVYIIFSRQIISHKLKIITKRHIKSF